MSWGRSALLKMLSQGDAVGIDYGRVVIDPQSGEEVPPDWMKRREHELRVAILSALDIEAYLYSGFDTGFYGRARAPGVTLQFVSATTGEGAYAIFNADLTRIRNVKGGRKGSPLPKKQFRVGPRSHFYKFWLATGLNLPDRLSKFAGYMGNLRGVLFCAAVENNRMDAGSVKPLAVSSQRIREAFSMDQVATSIEHNMDCEWTKTMDTHSDEPGAGSELQPIQNACGGNYGNKGRDMRDDTGIVLPFARRGEPAQSSSDEWLEEYAAADSVYESKD